MRIFLLPVSLGLLIGGCSNPAEDAVRAELIDGQSANFRDVARCGGDSDVWRGEVNGKNRMGAYTGFSPFFYDGFRVSFAGDGYFMDLMDRCYSDLPSEEIAADSADASGTEPTGSWQVRNETNPLDDSQTVIASLQAEEGGSRFDGPVNLVARCRSNQSELYVVWHDYLGDDSRSVYNDYKNVEVRVGEDEARTERWDVSTDKQATFSRNAISLLREMSSADRLVLQTTPYNESPVTAIFDLSGAEDAIRQVAETCSWEL